MASKITHIRPFGEKYSIVVSTLPEPLVIPREVMLRYQLKAGTMITEGQIARLRHDAELVFCDHTVARLLGARQHSIYEIRTKLTKRSFSPAAIKETVRIYVKAGHLDDPHFAASYGRQLIERNPMGRSWLVAALLKKGIERSTADNVADNLLGGVDEVELAVRSLRKRWSGLRQFDIERARHKAYTYLSRRGISYGSACEAFKQLQQETDEGEDNQDR